MAGYEEFSDPRLVELYDLLNPPGPDTTFFLSLPRPSDQSVLDVGCGTGLLAVEFARRGLDVTGADPASVMLNVARQRGGGSLVKWVASDAASLELESRFDLATMASHVFQFLLTDDDVAASLRNIRRHLAGGGRLAFDTRNPEAKAWSRWSRSNTLRSVVHPRLGTVGTWVEATDHTDGLVHFTIHYHFHSDGTTAASQNTLRFTPRDGVVAELEAAGFSIVDVYGDWDRSPFRRTSSEMIIVASK